MLVIQVIVTSTGVHILKQQTESEDVHNIQKK
jgi:hypothetical protein